MKDLHFLSLFYRDMDHDTKSGCNISRKTPGTSMFTSEKDEFV